MSAGECAEENASLLLLVPPGSVGHVAAALGGGGAKALHPVGVGLKKAQCESRFKEDCLLNTQ